MTYYLRPYEERHNYNPSGQNMQLPAGIPFELYIFQRHFYHPLYEGMTQEDFFKHHIFKFQDEFVFQSILVEAVESQTSYEWFLQYIMF